MNTREHSAMVPGRAICAAAQKLTTGIARHEYSIVIPPACYFVFHVHLTVLQLDPREV